VQEQESLEQNLIQESAQGPVAQPKLPRQLEQWASGQQEAWEEKAFLV